MSDINLNEIKERLKKYHDVLYTSPSDFKHISAKSDLEWLIEQAERVEELEQELQEVTYDRNMWRGNSLDWDGEEDDDDDDELIQE